LVTKGDGGALLAQRFKVLVLVPAILLTAFMVVLVGYHYAATDWQILGAVVADIICLQIGYLAGAGLYHLLIARLANAIHPRTLERSISASGPHINFLLEHERSRPSQHLIFGALSPRFAWR